MLAKSRLKSDVFKAIHDNVSGMARAGTIDKAKRCHLDENMPTMPTLTAPGQAMPA